MKMNCRKTTAAHLPMPAGITYGNQQENLAVIIKGCRQAGFRKFINFPAPVSFAGKGYAKKRRIAAIKINGNVADNGHGNLIPGGINKGMTNKKNSLQCCRESC